MKTECKTKSYEFQALNRRKIVAKFDGGKITSDGGALLLREVEKHTGIIRRFASCFTDHRHKGRIEYSLYELLAQRVYALALGYEDLNDHDALGQDVLLASLVGRSELTSSESDGERLLAGKSTLNRLELRPKDASADERYKKISVNEDAVNDFFVDAFIQMHSDNPPKSIVLDLDATDDPIHGEQEGRFFHGYYGEYCYLPLYAFCGEDILSAKLRTSGIDASEGALEEIARMASRIRASWPDVKILVRGDSGFCRDDIMTWCEGSGVDYLFGLAKNPRIVEMIKDELEEAKKICNESGKAARVYKDFAYRTRESWSRERRVVGKAEYLSKGGNPRFVVTSVSADEKSASVLYEDVYCQRGDMENRIKEQQLWLFADRTSSSKMRANQIRLWFSSVAYMLISALRRLGLAGTEMSSAQSGTIRLKILKIGALIKVTFRKIWVSFAEGYPYEKIFARAYENLFALRREFHPVRC